MKKWKLVNKEEAKRLHIYVVEEIGLCTIDFAMIPNDMSIKEYIKYLIDNQVIAQV